MSKDWGIFNFRLLRVSIPLLVDTFFRTLMAMAGVFLLSRFADHPVQGLSSANIILVIVQNIVLMCATGCVLLISVKVGAQDFISARQIAVVGLFRGFAVGLLLSLAMVMGATWLLQKTNLSAHLLAESVVYLRIVGSAIVLQAIFSTLCAICRGFLCARVAMKVVILANLLQLSFMVFIVFTPFALPISPILGFAISYLVATAIGVILLSFQIKKTKKIGIQLSDLSHVFEYTKIWIGKIVKISLPLCIKVLQYAIFQMVVGSFLLSLGEVAVSAHMYVTAFTSYIFMLSISVAQASQLVEARMIGAGEMEGMYPFVCRSLGLHVGLSIVSWGLVFLVHAPILRFLSVGDQVLALVYTALLLDLLLEIGRAVNHCFGFGLRAVGDVRYTMIIAVASTWCICLPCVYVFTQVFSMGLPGVLVAFIIDEMVRAFALLYRWKHKKWIIKAQQLLHST